MVGENLLLLSILLSWFLLWFYIYVRSKQLKLMAPWHLLIMMIGHFFGNYEWRVGFFRLDWFSTSVIIAILLFPKQRWQEIYISNNDLLINMLIGVISGFFLGLAGYLWATNVGYGENQILAYQTAFLIGLWGVGEELLFRGFVLGNLRKLGLPLHLANLVQSAFFTLLHIRYIVDGNFAAILLTWTLGLLSGYTVLWRKNIFVGVVMHLTANYLAFFL
jgi:membrane protease YdiL (CAAX protease family)